MTRPDEWQGRRGMVTAFDDAARDFDTLSPYLWDPLAADTLTESQPQPGERVLDACCGTGASARPSAAAVGSSGHVDAVDVSAPMIARLRDQSVHLPQLHPHVHDVGDWPGGGYDLVQSVMGIFFLPDMARASHRLATRCRPGGRVAFTIWHRGAMVEAGRQLTRAVCEVKGEEAPHGRPRTPIDDMDTVPAYRAWLERLGLTDVSVVVRPRQLPATSEMAWLLVMGSGFRSALTGLDDTRVSRVRTRYLDLLLSDAGAGLDASSLVGLGGWRGVSPATDRSRRPRSPS